MRDLDCHYEPHTKTQKDELIHQLQTLRGEQALMSKENQNYSLLLDIITKSGHVDEIIRRLRRGDPIEAVVGWLGTTEEFTAFVRDQSGLESRSLTDAVKRIESMFKPEEQPSKVATSWTSVTSNGTLIQHLLKQYFLWVHPNVRDFSCCSYYLPTCIAILCRVRLFSAL